MRASSSGVIWMVSVFSMEVSSITTFTPINNHKSSQNYTHIQPYPD
jgi:hypothetical protein